MIILKREVEGADPKGHFGLATLPAFPLSPLLRSLGGTSRTCCGGLVATGPGLGGHQGASGHAEAAGPAAVSATPHPPAQHSPDPAAAAVLSTCRKAIFTAFS